MCFFDNDGWAVLVECKIQAKISVAQLRRHSRTAARYGFEQPSIIVISVDSPKRPLPEGTVLLKWKNVYQWFTKHTVNSTWSKHFVNYMEVFESTMLAKNYDIRGTLTMFDGFKFNERNPYTYSEGKRLIKLLGEEFRNDTRLVNRLGLDKEGKGRGAITRGEHGNVWDFIPLLKAKKASLFTEYPHATMGINPTWTTVAVTIPHGIKGGIKGHLREIGQDGFGNLLSGIEQRLREALANTESSKPMLYIVQRHYPSQRSTPVVDGRIEVDLRTVLESNDVLLKHQPMWCESVYNILTHKKTNIQWGIDVHLFHSDKEMQSRKALKTMAEAWIAMKPLIDFATGKVKSIHR
jgi:hypothetical protein